MRLSIASISVCLPLPLCLSGPVCLSVSLLVYRPVGNHSVCVSVACLSVCVSVTTRLSLSVRLPTSWGRHPESLMWSSTVTPNIQPMTFRGLQVPFDHLQRSHVPWPLRQFTRAVDSGVQSQFLTEGNPRLVCGLAALWFRADVTLFSIPYRLYPKTDLSTFVSYLMICLMSYGICLMSYLTSYVILRSYDLTALVYVLLLGLVSMHFVLCRFYVFLRIWRFLSSLRILILLEEPPHLTAD